MADDLTPEQLDVGRDSIAILLKMLKLKDAFEAEGVLLPTPEDAERLGVQGDWQVLESLFAPYDENPAQYQVLVSAIAAVFFHVVEWARRDDRSTEEMLRSHQWFIAGQ
jgi:hypothetical protein